MPIQRLSNPKSFTLEATKYNITDEYLNEAVICLGKQKVARMFSGKSNRGSVCSLSSGTIDTWLLTFKFIKDNPDHKDNELNQPKYINPTQEWYDYVKLIREKIPVDVVESWENLSNKKLGDQAIKYGLTVGVRNSNAVKDLHERLIQMVDRRLKNIWENSKLKYIDSSKVSDSPTEVTCDNEAIESDNYDLMNIFRLKEITKERKITTYGKNKSQIIESLRKWDRQAEIKEEIKTENNSDDSDINDNTEEFTEDKKEDKTEYSKYTLKQLKNTAKDRGFNQYNNLKKAELVKVLEENDLEIEKEEADNKDNEENIEKYSLILNGGDKFIIPVRNDGYVNATLLCKAGGKKYNDWYRLENTKKLIKCLESDLRGNAGIPAMGIIQSNIGGDHTGSWIHPDLAVQLAQWVSPEFSLQVSKWIRELLNKGSVKLERPVRRITDLNELDIEAEELEINCNPLQFTNEIVLYIAYIGDKLIKIGYSDHRFMERLRKHQSTESRYKQFRLISVFKISGRDIEKRIKELICHHRVEFEKQSEVYRVLNTLKEFIDMINLMLRDNDLRMIIKNQKERIEELERENLSLRNRLECK